VILPTLLLIGSVIGAYLKGKIPGLVSVLIAYAAGLVILSSAVPGLVLLGIASVVGYWSARRRHAGII